MRTRVEIVLSRRGCRSRRQIVNSLISTTLREEIFAEFNFAILGANREIKFRDIWVFSNFENFTPNLVILGLI